MAGSSAWLAILVSLGLALLLSIAPLPDEATAWRPEWVALVLVQWCLLLPDRVGIVVAWLAGFLLDVLEGAPLGQNALALSVMIYLVLILYQRLRMFTLWQQMAVIFVLIGLEQLLAHWVQTLTGTPSPSLRFLLPAVTSALIWPVVAGFIRLLQRFLGTA